MSEQSNYQSDEFHKDFVNNGKWFPKWKAYQGDLDGTHDANDTVEPVHINEYLPAGKSILLGIQHTFAMFGATVLAPVILVQVLPLSLQSLG